MDENENLAGYSAPDAAGEGVVEDIEIRRSAFRFHSIHRRIQCQNSKKAILFVYFPNESTK
jgi:hypothetical protein